MLTDPWSLGLLNGNFELLGEFPNLRVLNLGYCKVTDAGVKQLAGLEQLQSLAGKK